MRNEDEPVEFYKDVTARRKTMGWDEVIVTWRLMQRLWQLRQQEFTSEVL